MLVLGCLFALIEKDAESLALRILEVDFAVGFAGKYNPFKKGSIAKCQLGMVKGCVKRFKLSTLLHLPFQVMYLEKKVTELENDSLTNGDLKSKLKQENTQLVHR